MRTRWRRPTGAPSQQLGWAARLPSRAALATARRGRGGGGNGGGAREGEEGFGGGGAGEETSAEGGVDEGEVRTNCSRRSRKKRQQRGARDGKAEDRRKRGRSRRIMECSGEREWIRRCHAPSRGARVAIEEQLYHARGDLDGKRWRRRNAETRETTACEITQPRNATQSDGRKST